MICKRGSSCTVFVASKLGKLTFIDTSNRLKIIKKKKSRFRLDIRKKLYSEGGEALARVAQSRYGCPIPGSV